MGISVYWRRLRWFLRQHPAWVVLVMDALLIPCALLCRWLTDVMFDLGEPCKWALVGARCATCGGTHCVQSFLQGRLWEALEWNPMVFGWILYGLLTVVLLNVCHVFHGRCAGEWLRRMYSLTAFFIGLGIYLGFTLVRNIPFLLGLFA